MSSFCELHFTSKHTLTLALLPELFCRGRLWNTETSASTVQGSFFPEIFLRYAADEKIKILLRSKIVKIRTFPESQKCVYHLKSTWKTEFSSLQQSSKTFRTISLDHSIRTLKNNYATKRIIISMLKKRFVIMRFFSMNYVPLPFCSKFVAHSFSKNFYLKFPASEMTFDISWFSLSLSLSLFLSKMDSRPFLWHSQRR